MNFSEIAKRRYSCRKYKSQKVEKEKLGIILEAAHVAPLAIVVCADAGKS